MQRQFVKIHKTGTHVLLSAVEHGQLVGSVMGIICEELYGNCQPFMVLENMIVDKNYRNQGIGKALLAELEKIAIMKKCIQIILVTDVHRAEACKFYQSAGYSLDTHKGFKKKLFTH